MSRVVIATLGRPRGNKGELTAVALSNHRDRYEKLERVFVSETELAVERTWWHGDTLIFKFAGVDSIGAAEGLSGKDVEIPEAERVELEDGEHFLSDLMGCGVRDRGELIGHVTGWQEIPGQILLEVGTIEIPYRLVKSVDLTAREIEAELPEGLKDLNA